MLDIAVTKMSSKGQVVIPQEMRGEFKEGEKLVIIKNDDQLILKKLSAFDKKLEEDLLFAKKTEEAYQKYLKGEFITVSGDEFLRRLKKW